MSSPLQTSLPYGLKDIKLTAYTDALGTVLDTVSIDLPVAQTLSFSEAEEFSELRGDDKLWTTHGRGSNVDWSLESGGIPLAAWKAMTGGALTESGVAPNRSVLYRKKGSDQRPWFRIEGQAISDSGGDLRAKIFRCKVTGEMSGDFGDGEFFVTNAGGQGLPLLDDMNDLLYEFIQNEQKTQITLTPTPNPIPTPQNVQVSVLGSTTATLTWDAVSGATLYTPERSVSPYTTWVATTPTTSNTNSLAMTGLTATTSYKFRVKATTPAGVSDPSAPTGVVTTTA